MYRKFGKRLFDIISSLCALAVLLPVLLIIAVIVRVNLGSPVIFSQKRPGLNGKIFTLYKFRTMTNKTDAQENLLPDSERLTKVGKTLRSTSLDELPELWNILKGDMSVVGPRPLLVQDYPFYTEEEKRRHNVYPGLTGLAQINGRNLLNWNDRLALDVKYVDNISFLLDMGIVIKTIFRVLFRDGADACESNLIALDLHVERGCYDYKSLNVTKRKNVRKL
jgi:lipopolysaccharide/colanic/teichoic acid biosynthesis glycosyltransferase